MKKVLCCSEDPAPLEQPATVGQRRLPASKASCWVCPEEPVKIACFRLWIVPQERAACDQGVMARHRLAACSASDCPGLSCHCYALKGQGGVTEGPECQKIHR